VVLPETNSIAIADLAGMTVERVVPAGERRSWLVFAPMDARCWSRIKDSGRSPS